MFLTGNPEIWQDPPTWGQPRWSGPFVFKELLFNFLVQTLQYFLKNKIFFAHEKLKKTELKSSS